MNLKRYKQLMKHDFACFFIIIWEIIIGCFICLMVSMSIECPLERSFYVLLGTAITALIFMPFCPFLMNSLLPRDFEHWKKNRFRIYLGCVGMSPCSNCENIVFARKYMLKEGYLIIYMCPKCYSGSGSKISGYEELLNDEC